MRTLLAAFAILCAALLASSSGSFAQDKKTEEKQTTLKGKITCNKCDLGKSSACETVIVVKNDKKMDIVYFFDAASHKKYHGDVCTDSKAGTVVGSVKEVEKKKVVNVKKLTYDK